MTRHFVSQTDLTPAEVRHVFEHAKALKPARYSTELLGKSLVMFFEKTSTRTRLSFEIGMTQLGGHAVFVDTQSSQLARGESIADTARVVSRYADLIMARVMSHTTVVDLSLYASIPVINGLSDEEHPCQSMAAFFTLWERRGSLAGLEFAYVGDGDNNVTHSLMLAAAQLGVHVRLGVPQDFSPQASIIQCARDIALGTGATLTVTNDPVEAVRGADVVYTDVWVSMGRETDEDLRLRVLRPFQINSQLLSHAKNDVLFMHCLPAHIGDEVTAEVAYGPNSLIFDEAENRLHVQKALMLFVLGTGSAGGT